MAPLLGKARAMAEAGKERDGVGIEVPWHPARIATAKVTVAEKSPTKCSATFMLQRKLLPESISQYLLMQSGNSRRESRPSPYRPAN
jgi:hypothetical protein